MTETVRLVLVDDHGLCRRGLTELFDLQPGLKVIGATGDPDEVVRLIRDHSPDLLVMDLRMPIMDGLTLSQHLRAEGLTTPIAILTMSESQDDLANALRAGVRGYLIKDMNTEDVIESIRRCAKGELVIAPAMAAKLAGLLQPDLPDVTKDKSVKLTEREREILGYLVSGKSNKAIARSLNISHDTVKLHVRHIFGKLNLTSRVEAAVFAVEHGVVSSPRVPAD